MEILLKLSAVLGLFYLCYMIFLRQDTFFQTIRWFLNMGMLSAFIIPFISIPIYVTRKIALTSLSSQAGITPEAVVEQAAFDWNIVLLYIYLAGVVIFMIQLIFRLGSLLFLIISNPKTKQGPYILVAVKDHVSPFSFFNYIVYRENQFSEEEFQQILAHEKVHVNQWHSIDILLSNLLIVFNWFNPIAWLFKKQLEQNLEFIADQEAQAESGCERSYQKLILKSTVPNYQMVLANNFYNSLIKKRIVMLHKDRSKRRNQLKLLTIIPLLALFMMSFSTKEINNYDYIDSSPTYETISPATAQDEIVVVVDKDMSKDDLKELSNKMEAEGVTLKFKGIKRNSDGEITSIEISAKTKNSTTTYEAFDDVAINPVTIRVKGNSISISDGREHMHGKDYHFKSKEGEHEIHTTSKGANVWIHDSDHDGEHETEVISGDEKIIIKRGNEVKEVKVRKGKGAKVIVTDDNKSLEEVEVIELDEGSGTTKIISRGKDGKVIQEKVEGKGGGIFVYTDSDEDEEGSNIFIRGGGKNEFIFGDSDGEGPLFVIDGKEVKEGKVNDLDPEEIESINVLKGESAKKKYGDKAKNGVIEITTKKN